MIKYYTNPIQAAYMQDEFGIEFYTWCEETESRFPINNDNGTLIDYLKWYIFKQISAKDIQILVIEKYNKEFEPKQGDDCEYIHDKIGFMHVTIGKKEPLWKATDGKLHPLPDGSRFLRIAKRDNKAFFAPLELDTPKHPNVWMKSYEDLLDN